VDETADFGFQLDYAAWAMKGLPWARWSTSRWHKVVDLGLLVTAGFAHHMTELAYFFRSGLRNCENLCNQTGVSLLPRLPRSFCLHWRRFTLDTADRPL